MPTLPTSKDYTDLDIAQTKANFPFLKHFWRCEETSGLLLNDSAGTAHINLLSATPPAFGVGSYGGRFVKPNLGSNAGFFTTIPEDITGPAIVFAVLNTSAAGVIIGNTSDVRAVLGQTQPILADADTTAGVAGGAYAAIATTPGMRANIVTAWNSLTGQITYVCGVSADSAGATAAGSTSGIGSLNYSAATAVHFTCNNTVSELYMFGIMEFVSAIPGDYLTALAWMTKQAAIGNKVIYPGWYKYAG